MTDRTGFNPTLRIKMSDQTTVDLSYEYADHERFIDRGFQLRMEDRLNH